MPKKLMVLDVGSGKSSLAETWFADVLEGKEYEIHRADIDPEVEPDLIWDIRQTPPDDRLGMYNLILASHVLEHVERSMVIQAVKNMAALLANHGELWIGVPSLEWCAAQIVKGKDSPAVQLCIFGGGEIDKPNFYYHHTGFTLMSLRQLLEAAGLVVRRAQQNPFAINMIYDGEEYKYEGVQNTVCGVKNDPPEVIT